ncbi:cellulose synthase (UDP-forming) [Kitasatospora sp. MAP5-34]|nr:cellulose synthase catalytic subunit [Kitasatospora sp. MAP5-34]MDH6575196.1 cellulose synthase (UDP-forming) [Kitasatospora sp. MAP5-34]
MAAPRRSGLLPAPPDDREKYSYVKRYSWVLTLSSLVGFGFVFYSQLDTARHSMWIWLFSPVLLLSVVGFLIGLRLEAFTPSFDLKTHRRLVRAWNPGRHPSVDVFLPVCGEPVEVLHNTWTYVQLMADAYQGPVTAIVLDDSDSPELAAMAADFGFRYLVRPNRGWFKKAGNLRHGFENSDSDVVLILDADFAPRHDLLDELLPYLDDDPRTAIVQSPQYFRVLDQQNWIERGAGAVQELFYRSVQVSRQRSDGSICVGSCAIYRRTALAEIGGTSLIEHSEDMHTGFDLRARGWDLRYVPLALSTGVCPDTIGAYYNQQYRWCMASMSMLGSMKDFWRVPMRFVSRLCYMSGFVYYIETALLTFTGPLIALALLLFFPEQLQATNMWYVLPSVVYLTVVYPLWHRNPYRLEAWATRVMYGWAHTFAIWDLLRRRPMGWQPSGSSNAKNNKTRRFWIGMWAWSMPTAVLWIGAAVWRMSTMVPENFALMLGSGVFYAVSVGRVLVEPRTEGMNAEEPTETSVYVETANSLAPHVAGPYLGSPYLAIPGIPDPSSEPHRVESYRAEPYRTEPYRVEPYRAESYNSEPYPGESYRTEPYRTESYRRERHPTQNEEAGA